MAEEPIDYSRTMRKKYLQFADRATWTYNEPMYEWKKLLNGTTFGIVVHSPNQYQPIVTLPSALPVYGDNCQTWELVTAWAWNYYQRWLQSKPDSDDGCQEAAQDSE